MGDGFYRSKDPTNSIKVLKEMLQNTNQTTKRTRNTYAQTIIETETMLSNKQPLQGPQSKCSLGETVSERVGERVDS